MRPRGDPLLLATSSYPGGEYRIVTRNTICQYESYCGVWRFLKEEIVCGASWPLVSKIHVCCAYVQKFVILTEDFLRHLGDWSPLSTPRGYILYNCTVVQLTTVL